MDNPRILPPNQVLSQETEYWSLRAIIPFFSYYTRHPLTLNTPVVVYLNILSIFLMKRGGGAGYMLGAGITSLANDPKKTATTLYGTQALSMVRQAIHRPEVLWGFRK